MSAEKGQPIKIPNRGTPMGWRSWAHAHRQDIGLRSLTVRDRSLVISEPNLMALWMDRCSSSCTVSIANSASTARLCAARRQYHANIEYFDQIILRS